MAVQRVSVPYEHDPADLQTIYLAVTSGTEPQEHEWKPAYRDTRDGRRVVWVKTEVPRMMASVAELRVPLLAEVGSGLNWEAAH